MGRILIIGAGGVGGVVAHKCAMNSNIFSNITLASRTLKRCERIRDEIRQLHGRDIRIEQVDADYKENVMDLIDRVDPEIVGNLALGYQNKPILDACIARGRHYFDTATPEDPNVPGFSYEGQWAMNKQCQDAGIMAVVGAGFDPGVTSVFTRRAKDDYFKEIKTLDILDCNAGCHGRIFATNFDPEINVREITLKPRYWDLARGGWVTTPAIYEGDALHFKGKYPGIEEIQNNYLLYHEELESLTKHFPEIQTARFWMTFGPTYLKHLRAFVKYGVNSSSPLMFDSDEISPREMIDKLTLENKLDPESFDMFEQLGLFSNEKKKFSSNKISPVRMLGAVLPKPDSLAAGYTGMTSIGNIIRGIGKDGRHRGIYIHQECDHALCTSEVMNHGISYTAGVPAFILAMLMFEGVYKSTGVYNMEQLDPHPFMRKMNQHGLPWKIEEYTGKEFGGDKLFSAVV